MMIRYRKVRRNAHGQIISRNMTVHVKFIRPGTNAYYHFLRNPRIEVF